MTNVSVIPAQRDAGGGAKPWYDAERVGFKGSVVLTKWLAGRTQERERAAAADARRQSARMYAGAQMGRLTADWLTVSTSHDAELRTSLRVLRNRARQLVRDHDYAKNAVRAIKNNVVGQGIKFQAQVKMRRGGRMDDRINDMIEAAWARWARAERCHVAGKLSFSSIERLVVSSIAMSGEVLVRKVRRKFADSRVALALEIIESDQLVDEWNGLADNGNEVRMGVEVDEWQRPVAYWLYPRHPGDYQFQVGQIQTNRLIRVPADEIIHLAVLEDRPNATRGCPWFDTALTRLNNMRGYEEAEIVAARASASYMGFITSPEAPDSEETKDGQRLTDLQPGVIQHLLPGEEFTEFKPGRPNTGADGFLRLMLRGFTAGVGAAYETVSGDYSQSNFSSSRMGWVAERDNWRVIQRWLIEHFHQPLFEEWLEMAVLSGELALPAYESAPEMYQAVRWQPRGWEYIDPLKDTKAATERIRSGLSTLQDELANGGGDFEDVMHQRRRELDLAADLELVFDTDPKQVATTGVAQPNEAPAEEDVGQPAGNPDDGGELAASS